MAERYKIYDKLGAGGVGAVFRAYDNELKRWVAIKRLMSANDEKGDQNLAAELRREADALASLRNPNIVTIFDVASDADGLFMVMELLEGEDLADVVARGPLYYDDFKELASQTLEGLLAAHERHILHRDIKPENIKVERLPGGRMQSKIIDFGLARAGMKARKQTEDQEGSVMGSIFYMAPEQLTRAPVDVRTDLYALGCVFYEALSGRKAFDGETLNAVIDKHINHDIVPLNRVAPHVPPWLGAWVLRLMALNPEDRPANAQQAIEEFRAWEKMSAAPPIMPWMPQAQGQQPGGAYTQSMYPTGSITTGTVPVQSGYYQPPAAEAYAQPILEVVPDEPIVEIAAYTTPIARSSGPAPSRTGHIKRTPSARVQGGGSHALSHGHVHSPAHSNEPTSSPNIKLIAIIGGGVLLLLTAGWFIFGGHGDPTSGGSAKDSLAPAEVTFKLPEDRIVPPVDSDLCLHVVAGTGNLGADGNNAAPDTPVIEWHDLAARGNDNFFRAYKNNADYAPKRIYWPPTKGEAGAKANRSVLDFRSREGRPIAMVLTDLADEKGLFPFGEIVPPKGDPGLTLAIVFQADASSLPMRLFTLSSETDPATAVIVRIDKDKRVITEFRNGPSVGTVTSRDVDPTLPCVAVITWDKGTGATEVRLKDAPGKTFEIKGKTRPPVTALTRLQLGRVVDNNQNDAPTAEQYSGFLAEMILYASALKLDQIQLLESKILRDHYIQGPPAASPPKK